MRKRSFRYRTAFAVLLCILGCGRIDPAMASQEAASAAAGLSAGEDFYDAGKKNISVNFSAPAGVESALIAAAYDKDGRMLEKVVKNDEKTGTVSFTFSDPGRFFRVFAINRESLAPLARSLSLTRDVTSDDITTEEFTLDMPGFQDETAQALAAVIACGINAQKNGGVKDSCDRHSDSQLQCDKVDSGHRIRYGLGLVRRYRWRSEL